MKYLRTTKTIKELTKWQKTKVLTLKQQKNFSIKWQRTTIKATKEPPLKAEKESSWNVYNIKIFNCVNFNF